MNTVNDLLLVNPELLVLLTRTLRDSTISLKVAMIPYRGTGLPGFPVSLLQENAMANPVIQKLIDQVTATKTIIDSAVVLINGIADRITAAVADALANGATEAELAPLNDLVTQLKAEDDALAAAVQANTPPAPPVPKP